MYFLVYISTATELFSEAQLENILTTSRRNNTAADITGMLLYHDGAILQVLEGERSKVEQLLTIIEQDRRHYGVLKIVDGFAPARYFSEWSMGFRRLSPREWSEVEGYIPVSRVSGQEGPVSAGQSDMITFIQSFCRANFK